jgi:NAD(P)-dependent dehydrogenase (short-subunit alcohol dehydrogenase family)
MDVRGKTILIFGAWGQVGRAICRDLLEHAPQKLVVSSLRESEAREAAEDLGKEYGHKTTKIVPAGARSSPARNGRTFPGLRSLGIQPDARLYFLMCWVA